MDWQNTQQSLEARGYRVRRFANAKDAGNALTEAIAKNATVGLGGSQSIIELDVFDRLKAKGCTLYSHSSVPAELVGETIINAQYADWYLMSANAVTEDGEIWNIDGRCNRCAAMVMGTGRLIMVIGINKLVQKGEDPVDRIKRAAAPPNCARLGKNTPCAKTGVCHDCTPAAGRICNATVTLYHPPGNRDMELWLVDEALGF